MHMMADRQVNKKTSVTAVVVNFNGGNRLLACIRSITLQSLKPQTIILIDNASTDKSIDAVEKFYPDVNIIRLKKNKGPSVSRNVGLSMAKTDLILFIDADIYLTKYCLQRLMRTYRQQHAVICPRILFYSQPKLIQCDGTSTHFIGTLILHHNQFSVGETPRKAKTVGGCPSACLLIESKIAHELGGFNESYFFYFEDLEFNLNLRSKGYRIICEPNAVVLHDKGSGTSGLSFRSGQKYPPQRFYLTVRNRLMTIFVYYRLRTLILLLPVLCLYEGASLLIAIWRGWFPEWIHAWIWLFQYWKVLRRKRRQVQATRCMGDRALLMGGPLPISEGFVRSSATKLLLNMLSLILNVYWQIIHCWID